jgi:hypothetical protein
MNLHTKLQVHVPAPRRSWLSIIARVLANWVRRPRAFRRARWHDCDGAHRGF